MWFNVTADRIYTCIDASTGAAIWQEYGGPFNGKQEIPSGLVNGINVDFTITSLPIADTLIVLRNGVVVPSVEWSYAHPIVTFSVAPAIGQTVEVYYLTDGTSATSQTNANNQVVDNHTMSAGEITAKQFTLPSTPAVATKVVIDVRGGTSQIYGVDFIVTGDVVDFDGYGLDGQLIAGSIVRSVYYTN